MGNSWLRRQVLTGFCKICSNHCVENRFAVGPRQKQKNLLWEDYREEMMLPQARRVAVKEGNFWSYSSDGSWMGCQRQRGARMNSRDLSWETATVELLWTMEGKKEQQARTQRAGLKTEYECVCCLPNLPLVLSDKMEPTQEMYTQTETSFPPQGEWASVIWKEAWDSAEGYMWEVLASSTPDVMESTTRKKRRKRAEIIVSESKIRYRTWSFLILEKICLYLQIFYIF